jgi:hypothetical protein
MRSDLSRLIRTLRRLAKWRDVGKVASRRQPDPDVTPSESSRLQEACPRASRLARRLLTAVALAMLPMAILSASAVANTAVTSNITANTTWTTSGSPYDLDSASLKVMSGATLTIQPGVTVDFNAGSTAALTVEGTIKAVGSSGSPIVFTSHQALSGGGAPGQYEGVHVSSGNASSQFAYSDFYYGGIGSGGYYAYSVLLVAAGSTVSVEHSVFEHNSYSAIKASTATANVSYSTLSHNGDGVSLVGEGALNVTHSTLANNTEDGAFFNGTTTGPSLTYDTLTENGTYGIRVQQSCESALSTFPHGEYNNIYSNGPTHTQARQLSALYMCKTPLLVDWRNNYWGPEVAYYSNDIRCAATVSPYEGHLAYTWSKPVHSYEIPVGPITSESKLYSEKVEGTTVYFGCGWDWVAIGHLWEIIWNPRA